MNETNDERLQRLIELGQEPQTTVWDMSEDDLVWLIARAELARKLEKFTGVKE